MAAILNQKATNPDNIQAECSINDFEIKIQKFYFQNDCRQSDCSTMKGTAIITNNCKYASGIEVKVVAYDKDNVPIQVRKLWPESNRNIPTGDTPISLDLYLNYDKDIESINIQPIRVKNWQQ